MICLCRQGIKGANKFICFNIPYEVILGSFGIILLLEATRRAIITLVIITYSYYFHFLDNARFIDLALVDISWYGGEVNI